MGTVTINDVDTQNCLVQKTISTPRFKDKALYFDSASPVYVWTLPAEPLDWDLRYSFDKQKWEWDKAGTLTVTAPVNTVAPLVAGVTIGAANVPAITTPGTWDSRSGIVSLAFQWQDDHVTPGTFVNISGKTKACYDAGLSTITAPAKIRCRVTATNSTGATTADSNQLSGTGS